MNCKVEFDDVLWISNADDSSQQLHLDFSQFYCRLFEDCRLQCRDYLEEILRWTDGKIDNYDYVANNLMHITAARRRSFGFKH